MKLKGGYVGKIARVDLSKRKVKAENIDLAFAVKYVGGRGWCARIIWDEIPAKTDPLSPQNKLVVATGPLQGLLIPGAGKTSFAAISPATGFYGDSNVGGMWGTELKQAGFDGLILEGKADKLVYLRIEDGQVEFRDAESYKGMGSLDLETALKKDLGDELIRVASIGPAGEKLVRFACVTCDYGRQAGRTGVGAVMGAKNLKAIVINGSLDIPVADHEAMEKLFKESMLQILKHPVLEMWQRQGTMQYVDWANDNSCLPTRNFSKASFESHQGINGDTMTSKVKVADRACFGCPICCGNYTVIRDGQHRGVGVEGPEYETASMMGSNCGLATIEEVIYANYLCDNLGLDTISAGNVTAFAMECYEKGIITKNDLNGLELRFGDSSATYQFLEMLAKRRSMGDVFAEGVKTAAQKLGSEAEKFAMHVKGLEISGYDVRAAPAMGLSYATADIGAHHNRAWAITYDVKVGRDKYGEDKAKWVINLQHTRPLFDCLGACRFQWLETELSLDYYARFFTAATGVKTTLEELLTASERVWTLTRALALREGIQNEQDWLPERAFKDAIPDGQLKGLALDKTQFKALVQAYYKQRGWTEKGVPTKSKLAELRLEDVADAINAKN